MEYKYENVESVEVKQDFEAYEHDDNGELVKTIIIKQGTKGFIASMGWSSSDGFRHLYEIAFDVDGEELEVGIYEDKMEQLLILH